MIIKPYVFFGKDYWPRRTLKRCKHEGRIAIIVRRSKTKTSIDVNWHAAMWYVSFDHYSPKRVLHDRPLNVEFLALVKKYNTYAWRGWAVPTSLNQSGHAALGDYRNDANVVCTIIGDVCRAIMAYQRSLVAQSPEELDRLFNLPTKDPGA